MFYIHGLENEVKKCAPYMAELRMRIFGGNLSSKRFPGKFSDILKKY